MKTISVNKFCVNYNIPLDFIDTLCKYELVEVIERDTSKYIYLDDISRLERLMRMHYDLNVNFEGLDIINNLLEQVDSLQNEISELKKRLEFYE